MEIEIEIEIDKAIWNLPTLKHYFEILKFEMFLYNIIII